MGKEILFPTQEDPLDFVIGEIPREDIAEQHERARLVIADLEDIFYSAVIRAIGDTFGGD